MRSWAFLIFEAATISIALVILRVLCTLRIFIRISLVPGIRVGAWLKGGVLLPVLDGGLQRLLVVRGEVLLLLHRLHQRGVLPLDVIAHRLLGAERLLDVDVVEIAVV